MLAFVSELVLNLFRLFTRKLFHKILFNVLGEIVFQELLTSRNFIEKLLQEVFNMSESFIFLKKLFLDFRELRLGKVGKQADIRILFFFYTL